ncbi:MAG: hypothetical protein ACHQNV_04755 [Vicinamibacteria bacterium]
MTHGRRLATAVLVLLALVLLLVLVTGGRSYFTFRAPVGPVGFVARATLLGFAMIVRFHLLPSRDARMERGRLALLLLLLPTLAQFQLLGARLNGDGISYYVFLRSMLKDRDFDLADEYGHYGMLGRWDLAIPTSTGLRRSTFSVGPAVVWTPFFLMGESLARIEGWATGETPDLSGYGSRHMNAVALGNVLYGFAALLLIHALLMRHFDPGVSLGAVLLLWGGTFFHWYLVAQPTYAHSISLFLAAYALWLWDRDRGRGRDAWGHFFLGVVLGLAMCVRWQNGVLLILPGFELLGRLVGRRQSLPRIAALGSLLAAGVFVGSFPQMAAWKALYDLWVLPCPPQGCDFVRLDHPWISETLFSSRHGLFSWTPVFWAGYLGFFPFARRRPALAGLLAVPLLLMTYVNMCVGDWWGGASFSNRRFDSVLPILAFGVAASLHALREQFRRRPALGLPALVLPFLVWNTAAADAMRRGLLDPDRGLAFSRIVGGVSQVVSDRLGFPTTWPASWLFAYRYHLPPSRYDLMVGRYLFYRQNNLGPRLELASPSVEPFLDGAWSGPESGDGVVARCSVGKSRLFAALDVPEELELRFEVAAPAGSLEATVLVNGRVAGRLPAGPRWSRASFRVASDLWRRELTEVVIDSAGGSGSLCVASVEFVWTSRKGRRL